MPIIRTIPTANFTQFSNELVNTPMSFKAKDVLLHLLEKPEGWTVIKAAICKQLELSRYIVDKSLQWLRKKGYAIYRSSKHGGGQWYIFDTPQPKSAAIPVNTPDRVTPDRGIAPTISNTQTDSNIQKTTTTAPDNLVTLEEKTAVVVLIENEDLIYPAQLTPDQTKSAKHRIKKLKQPEIAPDVLFALAYAMAQGSVKSPVAYLNELVTRANNGTFEAVGAAGAHNPNNPNTKRIDATQEQLAAYRTINKTEPDKAKGLIAGLKAAARGIK